MIQRDDTQGNWSERTEVGLNALGSFPILENALETWKAHRTADAFNHIRNSTVIDVSQENPNAWRFERYGGRFFRSLTSPYIGDHPCPMLAQNALGDYMLCKEFRTPYACMADDDVIVEGDRVQRRYVRLVMPLDGGLILNCFQHLGE